MTLPAQIAPAAPTKALRVGIVGLGYAGLTIAESYLKVPDVEVVAIAGQEDHIAASVAGRLQIASTYHDWEVMLHNEQLDIVSIGAPNFLHCPIAIAAMEGGTHVLCEKPLATNTQEAEQMVRCAEDNDRVLGTVFNYRYRGDVQVLKQLINDGRFGNIYYVKVSWMRRRHFDVRGWYASKSSSGGGPLIDLGVHVLDLALYLLSEPTVVRASASTYAALVPDWLASQGRDPATWQVEDLAAGALFTAQDITILLEVSWASHGAHADDEMTIAFYGTEAGAVLEVVDYAPQGSLRLFGQARGELTETRVTVPVGTGHQGVAREFVEVVRSGDWSAHHGHDGLDRTRILDALYKSANLKREVVLGEEVTRNL